MGVKGHLHCMDAQSEMTGKAATLDLECSRMLYQVPGEDVTRPLKSVWI